MITSVTTTTVTTIAASGQGAVLGGIAVAVMLLLLVQRQLSTVGGPRIQAMSRHLSMAVVPLLVVFAVIVIKQVAGAF
jgi:hypothetical protein